MPLGAAEHIFPHSRMKSLSPLLLIVAPCVYMHTCEHWGPAWVFVEHPKQGHLVGTLGQNNTLAFHGFGGCRRSDSSCPSGTGQGASSAPLLC